MKKKSDKFFIGENQKLIKYIKKSRLFSHLPEAIMNQIVKFSEFVEYPAGAEILRQGESNQKIFFLVRGSVAVYAGGELILKLNRKGDIIGEMSVISEKLTSATVIAETRTRLFSIQAGDIGKYTDIGAERLQNMLYRIFAMILTEKLAVTTHKAQQYETVNRQLYHHIKLKKLTSTISSLFIDVNIENINDNVSQAVKMLGEFYGYQRSYLFLNSDVETSSNTIFEWHSDERKSWLKPFQKHLNDIVSNFRCATEKSIGIYTPAIVNLPTKVLEIISFEEEEQSLFTIPLLIKRKFIGFIGFSPAPTKIDFQEEDLAMIGIVGDIFQNVLDRKRIGGKLQQAYMAGMAENAVNVLHHIGNAITPAVANINSLMSKNTIPSTIDYLDKIHQTFTEHLQAEDLDIFLKEDIKGREMMLFFKKLIGELKESTSRDHQYLEGIDLQLQQITEIISLQQKYISFRDDEETFYFSTIINDVLEMMHTIFDANKIDIIKKIDPNLPSLTIEKNRLVHVLLNLLRNAVDSIAEQMKKRPDMHPTIEIRAFLSDDESIAIAFQDSGTGISEEKIKRVFELGYTTKKTGSGFGLYDCIYFIRLHKGELKITSKGLGHGATVEFTLPTTPIVKNR